MHKYIYRFLLGISLVVLITPTLAQQFASKHQNLVPKLGALGAVPNPGDAAQIQSDASKQTADINNPLIRFQMQYPDAKIVLDDATGLPYMIYNIQSERRLGTAMQVARDFLRRHRDLLIPGGDIASLQPLEVMQSRNAKHVQFQQVHQGVSVYLGVISVHILNGRVVMYTGAYRPPDMFRNLSLQPTLGESQTTDIAMQQLQSTSLVWLRGETTADLCIYSHHKESHLAYQLKIPAGAPLGDWEFLIDAHTGEILQQENLLMHVNGAASVYQENPITTRNPVNKTVRNLDGSGFLRGDFVDVLVFTGKSGIPANSDTFLNALENNASSQQNDFRFPPNDSRFDEANVYFHINRIHDYFKDNFDFDRWDSQMPVIVDYPAIDERTGRILNRPLNSTFFSPFTQSLAIGSGTGAARGGLNNIARDADMMYHEYTHAVIDQLLRLGIHENDFGRSMGEGYADYFSCSLLNDPDMGEWAVNSRLGMRNLENSNRFPDDIRSPRTGKLEEHFTGLIWGGACWTLRERLGPRDADAIVFNSLYFLPQDGTANFQNGLTALLQADNTIFNGAHQTVIREVFNDRGICEPIGCPLVSSMPMRGSIGNAELLGVNQYTVEVPVDATQLQVNLRVVGEASLPQYDLDIDLYVSFNQPVALQTGFSGQPQRIADFRSESERGIESITITAQSQPSLQPGTYFVGIVNWTNRPQPIDYELTATAIRGEPEDIPLTANVPEKGSISAGAPPDSVIWNLTTQYTVKIDDESEQLDVVVTPSNPEQDIDFAIRFDQRVAVENGQVIADFIEGKPRGGGTITLTSGQEIPFPIRNGTYFIAIGNFDNRPATFAIGAWVTDQPAAMLTSGTPVSGSSEPGSPPAGVLWNLTHQFQIVVPSDATSLTVKLAAKNPALDLDLAVRYDAPVQLHSSQDHLVADLLEETPSGIERCLITRESSPALQNGTYYIAIGSFAAQPVDWTLIATVSRVAIQITWEGNPFSDTPATATVEVNNQQQFTATVSGTANPMVIWLVNDIRGGNETVGRIGRNGLYTAPSVIPSVNPVMIRATSLVDQSQSASILVTIVPPAIRDVDLVSGVPTEGDIGPGIHTPQGTIWQLNQQYRINVPENAAKLIVSVAAKDSITDLDFAIRFHQRVEIEGRQIIGDFVKVGLVPTLHITPPTLQVGTYHIAVGNFERHPVKFVVTGTVITAPQTLSVAQDGTGDFTTIGEALEVANWIEIRDNAVYKENIVIERSQITLSAAPGSTPTIDGVGVGLVPTPVITIDTGSDVTISGLRLINGTTGILLVNGASGVIEGNSISQSVDGIRLQSGSQATVRNNKIFDNTQTGVRALESDIALIDNEIYGNGTGGILIEHPTDAAQSDTCIIRGNQVRQNIGAGIALVGNVSATIEGNRIEQNTAPDTEAEPIGGILVVDVTDDVTIRNNVIDGNLTHGLLTLGSQVDCVNNQLTRNSESGILVGNSLLHPDQNSQITVINCTIAGNRYGISASTRNVGSVRSAVLIMNTIIAENQSALENIESEQVFFSLIDDGIFTGENDNIGGTPAFVDSATGDYRLSNRSATIDIGTSKIVGQPTVDILGNPRIFDGDGDGASEIDIGAYEFQGTQPSAIEISPTVAAVITNQTLQFTATVIGTTDQRVEWQVNSVPGGSAQVGRITSDGVYTAPVTIPETNPVTIEALSLRDTSIAVTATVTINQTFPPTAQFTLLTSGVPIEGEIGPGVPSERLVFWGLENQYQIGVPEDAIELIVQSEATDPSQDIDLGLRYKRSVERRRGIPASIHILADFVSESPSASEKITVNLATNPPIQPGPYFIVAGNLDGAAAQFTLTATVRTGTRIGVPTVIEPGVTVNSVIGPGNPPDFHLWDVDRQYKLEISEKTEMSTVALDTTDPGMNLDLALQFNKISTIENGVFIADLKSQNSDGIEEIQLGRKTDPPLKTGTYYITIGNFEVVPVYFTLTAIISIQSAFPPWDVNEDGITDIFDLVAVGQQFRLPTVTNPRADVNGDGTVDTFDFVMVSSHFGEKTVPQSEGN